MKKQVVVIGGGDTFETYEEYLSALRSYELDIEKLGYKDWKANLPETLGEEYQAIAPSMPNKRNARYLEWEIWFDKLVPQLHDGVVLIGHSLGGIFLAKYLATHTLPFTVLKTFLIAAPFAGREGESLVDFELPKDLSGFQKQGGQIFIYHSKDDPVVPFEDAQMYKEKLPKATLEAFEDRGHFRQEDFDELVQRIHSL